MKIANIVTQAVLGAAVIVLFVLYFTGNGSQQPEKEKAMTGDMADTTHVKIAFINMDSVMANWDLYYDYQQELSNKQSELESDFAGRTENYYKSVQDAQYKVQRGLVTRSEAEKLQQQLAEEEQKLRNLQNDYSMKLQEEGMVKNRKMLDMIERYVADISEQKGYVYVFSYQFGGNLLYGEPTNDITSTVVNGLNKLYKTEEDME